MKNLAEELAKFIVDTKYEDIPESVVNETKILFMDSLGCIPPALTVDKGKMILALARRLGGPPESTIIGVNGKVSGNTATLANGELIGTVDYDATMSGGHAPPYVIPAPLAMAEIMGASGKELILALVLAFEISARVAAAVQQSHGFAGFSEEDKKKFSWGERWGQSYSNFGAAAGAGKVLGLNRDRMTHALGIAGNLCQVLTHNRYSYSARRHETKYGAPGWQSTGAFDGVLLAEMGFAGDVTVFDPDEGFWKFSGYEEWHPDKMMEDIGEKWIFPSVNYKLYPCCGMLHGSLDCIYKIINDNNIMPEEIESLNAFCHPTVAMPCFTNPEIENIADLQFNPHYVFAVAAHRVRIGVDWQDPETVNDPSIRAFGKKITCVPNPDYLKPREDGKPGMFSRVEIVARGQKFTAESNKSRGSTHGTDLTDEELIAKFRHNASRILTQKKINSAVDAFLNLEKMKDISKLMKLLTP